MAYRIANLEIPKDDPFKHDLLNRRPVVEFLPGLIKRLNGPFVMVLDSPWGSGKTTFVRILMADRQSKHFQCTYVREFPDSRDRQRGGSAPAHRNKLIASDWLVRVFNGRPEVGVDWAFPGNLPASPVFTRGSGMPARQLSIDADSRAIVAEMPNLRERRTRQLGVAVMPLRFSGRGFPRRYGFCGG